MSTRLNGSTTPPPQGAPVIFMDPRNPYAAHLLQDYAARLDTVGLPKLAEEARKHASEIMDWQTKNGVETLKDPEPRKSESRPSSR